MSGGPAFPALAGLPGEPANPTLCRFVERAVLHRSTTPNFLFTSGRPGRFNSRGVDALYCSEDQAIAGAEAERYRAGRTTQNVVYWIHPSVELLDLEDPAILNALALKPTDLFASWRFATAPTPTQQLGDEIAAQHRLGGIRFPSDAARARGFVGFNCVFFKASVLAPSHLEVRDDSGIKVQAWP